MASAHPQVCRSFCYFAMINGYLKRTISTCSLTHPFLSQTLLLVTFHPQLLISMVCWHSSWRILGHPQDRSQTRFRRTTSTSRSHNHLLRTTALWRHPHFLCFTLATLRQLCKPWHLTFTLCPAHRCYWVISLQ